MGNFMLCSIVKVQPGVEFRPRGLQSNILPRRHELLLVLKAVKLSYPTLGTVISRINKLKN